MRARWALLLLLVGCTEPRLDESSHPIAEEIAVDAGAAPDGPTLGTCGANRDPVLGTVCTYRYTGPTGAATLVGHQLVPGDEGSSDRVICTWRATCQGALASRTSPDERACESVIGTGCPPGWRRTVDLARPFLLPDGMTDGQLAAFCQGQPPHASFFTDACSKLDDTITLHEDICCARRPINELLDTLGLHPWSTPRP